MKEMITGFHSFQIRGRPITRREVIKYIQDNAPIFTLAPDEKDNMSKELCTDGINIWKE